MSVYLKTDRALLMLLLVLSPLYFAPSLGGTGFDLPFNISVWAAAVVVISYAYWTLSNSRILRLPKYSTSLLALPIGILISAVIAGVIDPVDWFFRVSYILGGVAFLFGLFQLKIGNTDRALLIVVISAFVLGIHGCMQITGLDSYLSQWMAVTAGSKPVSVFLQVNTMATYMVTGLLISVYLLFRPLSFHQKKLTLFLMLSVALTSFVISSSGSRTGLLSALIGLTLIIFGYHSITFRQWQKLLPACMIIFGAAFAGHEGIGKGLDKTTRMVGAEYADMRWTIYDISIDVMAQSPIVGHGIGSFLEAWGRQSAFFHSEHPNAVMPDYITHPHNELMLWGIEGGLLALLGIFISGVTVMFLLFKLPGKRKFAYLGILLPITFHTMVEMPFYLSSLHWFVWMIILFAILRHSSVETINPLSQSARVLIKSLSIGIGLMSLIFLFTTARAQQDIYKYVSDIEQKQPLQSALNNFYFKRPAEQALLRAHLRQAAENNDKRKLGVIVKEFERMISVKPELKLFEDVIEGYHALSDILMSCKYTNLGLSYYPTNHGLGLYQAKYCY